MRVVSYVRISLHGSEIFFIIILTFCHKKIMKSANLSERKAARVAVGA